MRRILLDNVSSGMKLAKPLYSADGRILLNAGLPLKETYIGRLRDLDVTYIYVEDEFTADIDIPDVVSEKARLEAVSSAKQIMDSVKLGKNVDAVMAKKVANNLVDELCHSQNSLVNFIDMRTRGDYLFSHSVNVCILSVLTGMNMGYDELRLRDLGVGALMHDVGKISIDQDILNKTTRLTEDERDEIKKHPTYGFEVLRKNGDINLLSAHCAFQHHERYDGSGYPRGLRDKDIHQYAHIVAIADVYDALTSDSTYRRAVPVYEALAIIEKAAGTYFEPETIEYFVSNIAAYPIGSVVRLNNNQIGVVVDISKEAKTRPVIRILVDENRKRVTSVSEIDLSKNQHIYIADVVER